MKIDFYHVQARLKPALLVVLPAGLMAAAWFPDDKLALAGFTAVLSSFGFCALLAQVGRDMGKTKEPRLFQLWGGKPTTVQLRHQCPSVDWITRARIHDSLSSAVGIPAPTKDGELADPAGADEVYEAFTTFLREATRDKDKFRLVYAENVSYGFRRNLWGMKPLGVALAALGMAGSLTAVIVAMVGNGVVPALGSVATVMSLAMLCLWCFWIKPSWVRIAAEAYAQRLLEACGSLSQPLVKERPKDAAQETSKTT